MNKALDTRALLRLIRGPASLRARGVLYHARPLMLAAVLGLAVAAYRAGVDTVDPLAAVLALLAMGGLASLCRGEMPRVPPAQPTPLQVGARLMLLVLAFGLALPLLTWLTTHHE